MMGRASWRLSGHEQWTDFQEKQGASSTTLDFIVTPIKFQLCDCFPEFDTIKHLRQKVVYMHCNNK